MTPSDIMTIIIVCLFVAFLWGVLWEMGRPARPEMPTAEELRAWAVDADEALAFLNVESQEMWLQENPDASHDPGQSGPADHPAPGSRL